jgi:hypothetical protein
VEGLKAGRSKKPRSFEVFRWRPSGLLFGVLCGAMSSGGGRRTWPNVPKVKVFLGAPLGNVLFLLARNLICLRCRTV